MFNSFSQNKKEQRLALFFTRGVSLETWERVGILEREIKPYKELAKIFQEIYFFTYGNNDDLKYQKILPENIKIFPKKWNIPCWLYSFLLPLFYKNEIKKVDILKTNQIDGSWSGVITKKIFKKKLIIRSGYQWSIFSRKKRDGWLKIFIKDWLEKLAYKNADLIMVSSEGDRRYIEKKYNIFGARVIPNYINTELFKPLAVSKENRICFVGRLEEQKNLFNLIKAVSELRLGLLIFGNGSLKKDLQEFAQKLKADVEFRGNIPNKDLVLELNKSKLFILPSFYEGSPKVLLEAMACELPVIGANVEGIREIIKHKENGYLCDTSLESINQAIKQVWEDKDLQNRISQNARKTILEKFSLEKVLDKEKEIYEKLF